MEHSDFFSSDAPSSSRRWQRNAPTYGNNRRDAESHNNNLRDTESQTSFLDVRRSGTQPARRGFRPGREGTQPSRRFPQRDGGGTSSSGSDSQDDGAVARPETTRGCNVPRRGARRWPSETQHWRRDSQWTDRMSTSNGQWPRRSVQQQSGGHHASEDSGTGFICPSAVSLNMASTTAHLGDYWVAVRDTETLPVRESNTQTASARSRVTQAGDGGSEMEGAVDRTNVVRSRLIDRNRTLNQSDKLQAPHSRHYSRDVDNPSERVDPLYDPGERTARGTAGGAGVQICAPEISLKPEPSGRDNRTRAATDRAPSGLTSQDSTMRGTRSAFADASPIPTQPDDTHGDISINEAGSFHYTVRRSQSSVSDRERQTAPTSFQRPRVTAPARQMVVSDTVDASVSN